MNNSFMMVRSGYKMWLAIELLKPIFTVSIILWLIFKIETDKS